MGDLSYSGGCRHCPCGRNHDRADVLMVIPFWLKIAGPIAALAIIVAGLMAYGHSKYAAGHKAGIAETDAKWEAAAAKLKADAAKSATKADDAAANRLENFVEQQTADQAKVDEAVKEGRSPLDAIFGS